MLGGGPPGDQGCVLLLIYINVCAFQIGPGTDLRLTRQGPFFLIRVNIAKLPVFCARIDSGILSHDDRHCRAWPC